MQVLPPGTMVWQMPRRKSQMNQRHRRGTDMTGTDRIRMFYNPRCSTCRRAADLLNEKGVDVDRVYYLKQVPDRAEIEHILRSLGTRDPRVMMRTKEAVYQNLHLDDADADTLIDAMVDHPILIQRPIVIHGDHAVIGRPPERVLEVVRG
jgi:arsenate reductase